MLLMILPTTSTFDGADVWPEVPLKMRTFSKSTPAGGGSCASTAWVTRQLRTNGTYFSPMMLKSVA